MQYLHPIFMLALLAAVIHIHRLGKQALAINPKSPEADQHDLILQQHLKLSKLITGLIFVGLLGGIFSLVQFLQVQEIFRRTYGHGFAGAIFLGIMLANMFVGKSIKTRKRQRPRQISGAFTFIFSISA